MRMRSNRSAEGGVGWGKMPRESRRANKSKTIKKERESSEKVGIHKGGVVVHEVDEEGQDVHLKDRK